ncbi:MAG: alpha/beta fold hydrolase [Bacteroidales bacterium]|nr:alpha/beta fold hydrolase [Bacteroidales bacterium]
MKLYYREFGHGFPLIVLHGLYGSSDNWVTIGKELGLHFRVILIDQRNHGQSPHSNEHNYKVLSNDLFELFDNLQIEKANLLGHSMGGKVAMQFTIDHSEKISSLIVVDIAPWSYLNENNSLRQSDTDHYQILKGLLSIPIDTISTRAEADEKLSLWVKSEKTRQFLLKNLKREDNGSFKWRLNLPIIASNIDSLLEGINPANNEIHCKTKTLFVKGGLSNYIPYDRVEEIKKIFSESKLVTIGEAGHWVHAEKPTDFLIAINHFLNH